MTLVKPWRCIYNLPPDTMSRHIHPLPLDTSHVCYARDYIVCLLAIAKWVDNDFGMSTKFRKVAKLLLSVLDHFTLTGI
jgi:hypothetical protein